MNKSELIAKVKELAPWHMDISLPEGIRTGEYHSNPDIKQEINVIDPNAMRNVFSKLYGSGLQGKRMLDATQVGTAFWPMKWVPNLPMDSIPVITGLVKPIL